MTDSDKFKDYAARQMRSGRCAIIHCPNFDPSIGPQESIPRCLECYERSTHMIVEPFRGHSNGPSGYQGSAP